MSQPPTQGARESPRPGGTLLWHHAWTAVLAANLVIPITFAADLFNQGGESRKSQDVGMALAITILWLVGDIIGLRSSDRRFKLISGGLVVAASQAFPLLQFFAGAASLLLLGSVLNDHDPKSGLLGFLTTLLTGSFLLLASYLAGSMIQGVRNVWRNARRRRLKKSL